MERRMEYLTYKDVEKMLMKSRTLVIPVGSLEAHGPHLPLGTDIIIPEELSKQIAEKIDALIAPAIPYGVTKGLLGFSGTATISETTLENMLYELLISFSRHGFELFVIMNGHGGNVLPIKNAAAKAWLIHGIKTIIVHWWIFVRKYTQEFFKEKAGHAAVDETAMIMAIDDNLVKREKYTKNDVIVLKEGIETYPLTASILLYNEEGGYPIFDQEKAKEYWNGVINLLVSEIEKLKQQLMKEKR